MSAETELVPIVGERVPQILRDWFATRKTDVVIFQEQLAPAPDPDASYEVKYEAVFEPTSLDQARVEVWVAADGQVAVGFEKLKRVAERMGVKVANDHFAAGHEPHLMTEPGLLLLLDTIADGEIAIDPTVVPLLGVTSTKAVITHDVLNALVSKGYAPVNWFKSVDRSEFSKKEGCLKFRRW